MTDRPPTCALWGMCAAINTVVLFENLDATEKVSAFHLFAVAKVELDAESRHHDSSYQIPPFNGAIYNTNRPVYNATD